MSIYAELADGRRLEFPDGTDPAVMQQTVKKVLGATSPQPSSDSAVAMNSVNKAIAGIPDAVLNMPNKIINLGKAAVGSVANLVGRSDLAPDIKPDPDFARRGFKAAGFITDAEPQDTKQKVMDAMLQAATAGAMNPAASVRQAVTNTLTGLAAGTAAGVTGEATHSEPLAIAASMLVPAAASAATSARPMNDVKAKTLADAEKIGYTVPASEKTDSFVNRRLESIGGKTAIKQEATLRNQAITNEGANSELGFPKGTAITEGKLEGYRDAVAQPYRDVAAVSPTAASALEELKQARYDAKVYGRHADISGDPQSVAKAKQAQQDAQTWERVIDAEAAKSGKPDLQNELRQARQQIAKSYDIERSLNLGSADISAPALGSMLDRGKPLSGNLEAAARFQQAFPNYAGDGSRVPTPGVSKSEAVTAAMLGTMGSRSGGSEGMFAAGLPLVSGPVRSLVLSKPYQSLMTGPTLGPEDSALRALLIARAVADRKGAK